MGRLLSLKRRRAKLAFKVDIELLEIRNTITEPISILGLSAGMLTGLEFLGSNRPDQLDVAAQKRKDTGPPDESGRSASRSAGVLPFAAVRPHRSTSTSGAVSAAGDASATVAPRKGETDSWLTATSRQRRMPGDASEASPLASRSKPAPRSTGGVAGSASRGSGPVGLGSRGTVTPLRFPRPGDDSSSIPGILGSTSFAGARTAPTLAGSSHAASIPSASGRVLPPPPPNGPIGGTNAAPMAGGGGVSGGFPIDIVPDTSPLTPFSHFPLYVLDYNYGSILFPGFQQYAVIGTPTQGWVDLRAQVRDTTASTYSWNTTGLTAANNISGANTYRLQFRWLTNSTAQTNSVTLTVTNSLGQQEVQTLSFWVPVGTAIVPGSQPTVTWPGSLAPDTVLPNGPSFGSQYVNAEINTGALETSLGLPTYNPNIPPVVLQYDSVAADPRPIVVVHHELDSSLAIPSKSSVQLTFNGSAGGTYYYATSAFNPGDYAQFAVQADATGLSTGEGLRITIGNLGEIGGITLDSILEIFRIL